ncbi:MAG: glutaminyl-peptide cyclotransferase [Calditrichia bacterium]
MPLTPSSDSIPNFTYKIVKTYPHDPSAYTQGLVYDQGYLYEGTGLEGNSSLRKVDLATGQIVQYLSLPPHVFGEGITIYEDFIIQLTWKTYVGYVYRKDNFQLINEFYYSTEGWGITHDGKRLIMSDGTAILHFLDPHSLVETGYIQVTAQGKPVHGLNELEFIQGEIFANVWPTHQIVRISPESGQVTGWIDLNGILGGRDQYGQVDVLNGIAYDAENHRIFVTGKLWPHIFEIELIPVP